VAERRSALLDLQKSTHRTLLLRARPEQTGQDGKQIRLRQDDIDAVVRANPDALTPDALTSLEQIALEGGVMGSPNTTNPQAVRALSDALVSPSKLPEGVSFDDFAWSFFDKRHISFERMEGFIEENKNQRFKIPRKALTDTVQELTILRPAARLSAANAEIDFNLWAVDNPEASVGEAQEEVARVLVLHDVYGLLNVVPVKFPDWFPIKDGVVDLPAARSALSRRKTKSGQGVPMSEEQTRQAWKMLDDEENRQERQALRNLRDRGSSGD